MCVCACLPYLLRASVVSTDDKAVVVHVEDDVLPHDGQPDEGDVGHRIGHDVASGLGTGRAEADAHCEQTKNVWKLRAHSAAGGGRVN